MAAVRPVTVLWPAQAPGGTTAWHVSASRTWLSTPVSVTFHVTGALAGSLAR
jgi:hypothetical protein